MTSERITPDQIKAKLNEIQGDVNDATEGAKPIAFGAAVAIGVAVIVGVYLLGRRKGKKRSTVVEIRRV